MGGFSNVRNNTQPRDEELIGLDLEERKRRRLGPPLTDEMDVSNSENCPTDSVLSNGDCSDYDKNLLATLARQASLAL